MGVELSNNQLEWATKEVKNYVRPIIVSFTLFISSMFVILYDRELKEFALGLFVLGLARILYR